MIGRKTGWPDPHILLGDLGRAFMRDLEADYREHGAAMIARLRTNDPKSYIRLLVSLASPHPTVPEEMVDQFLSEVFQACIECMEEAVEKRQQQESGAAA